MPLFTLCFPTIRCHLCSNLLVSHCLYFESLKATSSLGKSKNWCSGLLTIQCKCQTWILPFYWYAFHIYLFLLISQSLTLTKTIGVSYKAGKDAPNIIPLASTSTLDQSHISKPDLFVPWFQPSLRCVQVQTFYRSTTWLRDLLPEWVYSRPLAATSSHTLLFFMHHSMRSQDTPQRTNNPAWHS